MYENFLGDFEIINFQVKTAVITFWQHFKELRLIFISVSGHTDWRPHNSHYGSSGGVKYIDRVSRFE